MARHSILVVSYFYPPIPGVGGNRWLAMAKYLRRAGHDVRVLTTSAYGSRDEDGAEGVLRADDLAQVPALRRLLRRPPLPAGGMASGVDKPPPRLINRLLVPDPHVVGWVPTALLAARRELARRPADCVITSGPPDSIHLLGPALRRRGAAFIADFRDGWMFEPLREPFPTAPQRALDARLERRVVTRADGVLAATRPIAEDFRSRIGVDALHVPNGWDPDLDAELDGAGPVLPDDGRVALVHTGKLSGPRGRDPWPLIEAVRLLRRQEPELGDRLRVVLAGRIDTEEEQLLARLSEEAVVEHVGALDRAGAVDLQRRAGALLLMTSGHRGEATGKLFEYLSSGRPILALAESNEAARIVSETNTGITIPPRDVEAIAAALGRVVRGELDAGYAPRDLSPYVYPGPAEAVAKAVEQAVARR